MGVADAGLVLAVRQALADAADERRAVAMQDYMKSDLPFRGVGRATLRPLVDRVLDRHPVTDESTWRATVLELWDRAACREERYAALALARHRRYRAFRKVRTLDLYEHLVRTGAWWDLVDEVATHLVRDLLLAHPSEVAPLMREWAGADDLWVRRAALLCQVGARERCDQDLLAAVIEANLDGSTRTTPPLSAYGREFFVRKAVGWALRDHARTDPDWVRAFVASHEERLSGLSRREALRHLGPSVVEPVETQP
jgi:3-methyladenine DNA glycosylase AlkD